MPCKFLNASGSGSTSDAITCLQYVAAMKDRGVNIVATSNSWGGDGFSQSLYDAIDAQRQRGILFVAAAGNSNNGSNNDTTANYPSSYDLPNVIAVASTTSSDARSLFSNYGRHAVHLGAPGSTILSTTPGNTYSTLSGTSMATPHVSGVAALLKAQDPSRDWRVIRNLLLAGGDVTASMTGSTITGRRLNAFGSLTCSTTTVFSRLAPAPDVVTTSVGTAVTVSALNITCAAGAGNVTVTVSPGNSVLTLIDDGFGSDQVAGDGIYAGSFSPTGVGTYVLTFPDASTLTVQALSTTNYAVQATAYAYRQIGGTSLGLADDTSAAVSSPFPINFGGSAFSTLYVSSNGTVNVSGVNDAFSNTSLPASTASSLIAPLWDDLVAGANPNANVFWEVTGTAPHRALVVEWRNVAAWALVGCDATEVTFQVVFFEALADILFNYPDTTFGGNCSAADQGARATIGIQVLPTVARQHSFNTAAVTDASALLWTLTGAPGTFTDSPLVAGTTAIKAVHITELRNRIDEVRTRYSLPTMAWTDPTLAAGVTVAKSQHLLELRAALVEAYQAAGLAPPSFTNTAIQTGQTVISAAHLNELRAAVIGLEGW